MDNLDFLDGASAPNEEVAPEEVVAEAPAEVATEEAPQPEARPRDEKGRFAPKEATPETVEPTSPPPGYVPVGVVQRLREEMNQLKQAQQPAPDVFEDQNAFAQHVQQPVRNEVTQLKLNWSRRFAEQSFGADTVNTAEQWVYQQAQINPAFGQQILSSDDPYGAAVAEYKKDQIGSRLSNPADIDAFFAWKAAQEAADQTPPTAAPAAQPQPTPTRSLATAPSSGGAAHVPQGPGQAFDSLFTR